MPFVYGTTPSTNFTTNGTANTLTDHVRTLTGPTRAAMFNAIYLIGKGAGLTAISGIAIRANRYSTASTAGSAQTPAPRDPTAPASTITYNTGPTRGTTATTQLAIGCGAAGPGGWVAPNPDSVVLLVAGGGANGNVDFESISGTVSLIVS